MLRGSLCALGQRALALVAQLVARAAPRRPATPGIPAAVAEELRRLGEPERGSVPKAYSLAVAINCAGDQAGNQKQLRAAHAPAAAPRRARPAFVVAELQSEKSAKNGHQAETNRTSTLDACSAPRRAHGDDAPGGASARGVALRGRAGTARIPLDPLVEGLGTSSCSRRSASVCQRNAPVPAVKIMREGRRAHVVVAGRAGCRSGCVTQRKRRRRGAPGQQDTPIAALLRRPCRE